MNQFCNFFLFFGLIFLSSCANEEETFHSLDMDVAGIDLQKEAGVYVGEVDSSAVEFTITGNHLK